MAEKLPPDKKKAARQKLSPQQLQVLFGPAPLAAKPVLPSAKTGTATKTRTTVKTAPKKQVAKAPLQAEPAKKSAKSETSPKVRAKAESALKAKAQQKRFAKKPEPPEPAHSAPAEKPPKSALTEPFTPSAHDPAQWAQRWAEIGAHSQHLLQEFAQRQQAAPTATSLPSNMMGAFIELTGKMMADPVSLIKAQTSLWQQYLYLWQNSTLRLMGAKTDDPIKPQPSDKRFKDPDWQNNPVFDYIKETYLLTSNWLNKQVENVQGMDAKTKRKLEFYTKQFADALSPSNFVLTNPQVLRTTLETGGENLIKGLNNLLTDLEQGRISMTNEKAFKVGQNIAVTPGAVVYQNKLLQLIQYKPTTEKVAQRPLLIVPPWINKFYILDLKPENSFIKWAVDQGLTVFCISWVNPDAKLAELDFADYMSDGILAAMEQVQKICHQKEINIIGYCLGGTLLASTLAWLKAQQPHQYDNISSATYFTTMVDFHEAGDLSIFIDDEQLKAIEDSMRKTGFLDARQMATTFNLLRANDLIWSFVVNNYLLGKEPFPFDLLYWNSDSTRMPAHMHSFYLREMYQKNNLIKPGAIKLRGQPIDLRTIDTPTFILSAREDHIAPWAATYAATQIYTGPVKFVLAGSGHIAGVVNPPAANKYQHWQNDSHPKLPHNWLEHAKETPGSWWPTWRNWLNQHDGAQIPARDIKHALEPAPGSYVKVRAV